MSGRAIHNYQCTVPESGSGGDTGIVGPNEWNDDLQLYFDVNAQTGTSYAFQASDDGALVTFNNASAVAVTLSQAQSGAASTGDALGFYKGWFAFVKNLGAGTVTITPTTSTINGAASLVLTTGQIALIISDGTNYQALVVPVVSVFGRTGIVTAQSGDYNFSQVQSGAAGSLPGVPHNGGDDIGCIGEFFSDNSSTIGLSSGVVTNVCSLELGGGEWDVSGTGLFTGSYGNVAISISQTSATLNTTPFAYTESDGMLSGAQLNYDVQNVGTLRVNLSDTTTIYLVARLGGSVSGSPTVIGGIRARRVG